VASETSTRRQLAADDRLRPYTEDRGADVRAGAQPVREDSHVTTFDSLAIAGIATLLALSPRIVSALLALRDERQAQSQDDGLVYPPGGAE
jgi:hypothetical protein